MKVCVLFFKEPQVAKNVFDCCPIQFVPLVYTKFTDCFFFSGYQGFGFEIECVVHIY